MKLSTERVKRYVCIALNMIVVFALCFGLSRFGLSIKRTVAVGVVCLISLGIHCYKSIGDSDYLKKLFGLKQKPDRDYSYDWLRVLAVVMVIVTHAVQVDLSLGLVSGEKKIFVLNVLYMLCLACNLIYVMLSGALLIPYKEEKLSDFYLKRVTKVFFPMGVYFVFYMWQNLELEQQINGDVLKNIFVKLSQGDTPESPHYWLMYTLLSVYIVIPLFRYMFKDMPYKTLTSVVVISVVLMAVALFSPVKFRITTFLSEWEGVAIIGYWVTRPETKKYYKLLIGLGIAAFAVMIAMIYMNMDYRTLCCNTSPIMTLISVGIFAFVFDNSRLFSKGNVLLKILSKYSYSLILIHWWTLHWIARGKCNIQIMQYHGAGLFLSLFVTLSVSLVAAILIDNYIVIFVEQLFDWVILGIRKIKLCFTQK